MPSKHQLTRPYLPLAERVRPQTIEEFVGQSHLLGPNRFVRRLYDKKKLISLIFWGPPGCGKTTLAHILAKRIDYPFRHFSAVLSGIKDVREVVEKAKIEREKTGRPTILFIDEVHRFNKAQQEAFLPYVERGLLILIGATTQNPSFALVRPLLSRVKVLLMEPLSEEEIVILLKRTLKDKRGFFGKKIEIEENILYMIANRAEGDARKALNLLELMVEVAKEDPTGIKIDMNLYKDIGEKVQIIYDRDGEEHFNLISAFHKSLRGSDPDAAVYWLIRMIEGGEDPLYIARRMVAMAAEDIGNADPKALLIAMAAKDAFEFLGLPEGYLPLAQAAIYLATAPKSNSVYKAIKEAKKSIKERGALPVPLHLRNAPTALMKNFGYGKGYLYAHDEPEAFAPQVYLPEKIKERIFYKPSNRGYEKIISERLSKWRNLLKKHGIK